MKDAFQRILGILDQIRTMPVDSVWDMAAFGAVLVFGLLNCFLGYRLLRFWVMLCGFAVGAGAGFFLTDQMNIQSTMVYFGVMVGLGIIVAVIAFLIYRAGIFLFGAGSALVISVYVIHPTSSATFFLCMLIGAVVGVLAIRFEREVTIVGTSILGGGLSGFCAAKLLSYPQLPTGLLIGGGAAVLGMLVQFLVNRQEDEEEEEPGEDAPEKMPEMAGDGRDHFDPYTGEPLDEKNPRRDRRR